ncbi:TIGR03936 family radical SAM-associated protein [Chloroflexota bacterium]
MKRLSWPNGKSGKKMQRLRVKFSRGDEIKYISHLDIMRLWERTLHRAQIKMAYSEGFNPRPRISLAVPLAVGVTSEAELMDIFLTGTTSPHWFTATAGGQLPHGIEISGVYQVAMSMPSLQSQVRFAEYGVTVEKEAGPYNIESAISDLLSKRNLPWHHLRDTGKRSYDLRALIDDIMLVDSGDNCYAMNMRLRCDNSGSGRPEQVTLALGITGHPKSIHRTRLVLKS